MAEVYERAGVNVAELIAGVIYPALDPGMTLRPALHDGRLAERLRVAMWNSDGDYALLPHEDISQLSDPEQEGFEIQRTQNPVAVNFYPAMPEQGGQLRVWDIAPDARTRQRLGISTSGFPYPLEALDRIPYVDIKAKAGDAVFLQGRFVHAVLGSNGSVSAPRITMNGFFGISADGSTVIQWT